MRSPGLSPAMATILLLAACAGGPSPSTTTPASAVQSSAPHPSVEPATPEPSATLDLPPITDLESAGALAIGAAPFPDFLTLAGDYAFVGGVDKGVGRFDLTTGALVDSIVIEGEPCASPDAGLESVWTATCEGPGLVRIDTATGATTAVDVGGIIPSHEATIGVGEGAAWIVVGTSERELVRVDPATNAVSGRFPISGTPVSVRAGLGDIWVADPPANVVHRVDPTSGAVLATIGVGEKPQFLAVGEGAVWTLDQNSGTISRIDPATNTVVATIALGEPVYGGDIAAGGGSVWVRGRDTLLFQADPATNAIVAIYGPGAGSGGVSAKDDAVWFTAHAIRTVYRLPIS